MKKLILAASLLAPLAIAAPALAQVDASPNAAVTNAQTVSLQAPREFTARRAVEQGRPAGVSRAEQNLIDRQGEAGSGF
jgi:hypothetical protein